MGILGSFLSILLGCLSLPLLLCAQVSLPLAKFQITSSFGPRIHPITGLKQFHSGIDLSANFQGVNVMLSGVVIASGENAILGKYIKVKHGKLLSIYGHLSRVLVSRGDVVHSGQRIAISGNSGRSTGPHLHLSIKISEKFIDPLAVIKSLLALTIKNHMDSHSTFENDQLSLLAILSLLAEDRSISLSPAQASEYGVAQADEVPEEEGGQDG